MAWVSRSCRRTAPRRTSRVGSSCACSRIGARRSRASFSTTLVNGSYQRHSRRSSKPCVSSGIDGRVVYWIGALDVSELTALGGTPQHERASTHVATPDELPGKAQSGPQHILQWLEVLRRRDAAKQDGGVRWVQPFGQSSGIPPQWAGVPPIAWVYRDPGDRPQPVEIDQCIGRPEAQPGYDDLNAGGAVRRIGEG